MQIINSGTDYRIVSGGTTVIEGLPKGVYGINFAPNSGFWLSKKNDCHDIDFKIYGNTLYRVNKIFNTFERRDGNLGVLLSGERGMGKTLLMKAIAIEACNRDLPVVIVDKQIPGVADFIAQINQKCVVLMDEFEKVFPGNNDEMVGNAGNVGSEQNQFLTLLDGIVYGKKIFVATINNEQLLSQYFINRTGRFYYHFKFKPLDEEAVREYCSDRLFERYSDATERIVTLSMFYKMNYDILSAIIDEINNGYSFSESIADLNISTSGISGYFRFEMNVGNVLLKCDKQYIHIDGIGDICQIGLGENGNDETAVVNFQVKNWRFDNESKCIKIGREDVRHVIVRKTIGNILPTQLNMALERGKYGDLFIYPAKDFSYGLGSTF